MAGLVKNNNLFYVISFFAGILFYKARFWFYEMVDAIFVTMIDTNAPLGDSLDELFISFLYGVMDGIIPALICMGIIHFILAPKNRQFLIPLVFGFLFMHAENLIFMYDFSFVNEVEKNNYLHFSVIGPLGNIFILWFVAGLYLKYTVKKESELEDDPRFDA